jgi:hypothetical protein
VSRWTVVDKARMLFAPWVPARAPEEYVEPKPTAIVHYGILPDHTQAAVIHDPHPRKICIWGRQSGKTTTILLWLHKRAASMPNTIHWYVAPTYKQAKRIAWDAARSLFPRRLLARKPNESELSFSLTNGSKIVLVGADDPDSLRGPSLTSVALDEYGTMRSSAWTTAIQPMLTVTHGHAMFSGTPNNLRGPHMEALWHEAQSGKDPRWAAWHRRTVDAAHVDAAAIEAKRGELREWEFRQEYEAEFVELTGRIWPEFVDTLFTDPQRPGHLFLVPRGAEVAPVPRGWELACGLDFGFAHPTAAVWIAIGPSNQIRVVAEYVANRRRASDHAREIKRISNLLGGLDKVAFYGDPSAPQMFEEFLAEGIYVQAANNAGDAGRERVGRLLAHHYLTVSAGCTNLIRGMLHYVLDPRSPNRPRVLKEHDDEVDALRYAVMSALPPEALSGGLTKRDANLSEMGGAEDERFDENWNPERWLAQWQDDSGK